MFTVNQLDYKLAKDAWNAADHRSLFCSPSLLSDLGYHAKFFGGYKNDSLLIVWPLIYCCDSWGNTPALSYFFGPYWVDSDSFKAPYKIYRNNLELLNVMLPVVTKCSDHLSFSLIPEFPDLRPFQWWNYHTPDGPKFKIKLRYTARLRFPSPLSEENLIALLRADDKRKKLKKARKSSPLVPHWNHGDLGVDEYLDLYNKTLNRTGGSSSSLGNYTLEKMIRLTKTQDQDENSPKFHMIDLIDADKATTEGFQLLLVGKNAMYLIAQSVSRNAALCNGNVILTFEALKHANKNGLTVDFNGANSPNRADDKHAFGGDITSYYDMELINR